MLSFLHSQRVLSRGQRGAALLAADGARPEVGDRRLGDPSRVARVPQVGGVKLGVQRVQYRDAGLVRVQEAHGLRLEVDVRRDRLEVGVGRVVGGQLPARPRQNPPAPGAHVPGEVGLRDWTVLGQRVELALSVAVSEPIKLRPQPGALETLGLQERLHEITVLQGEGGQRTSLAGEPLGVLQGALEDEPGNRVDVHGRDLAAQSHGFKGDGAAAGEWVQHPGGASAVGLADLVAEPLDVRAALPAPVEDAALGDFLYFLYHAPVKPLALDLLDDAPGHALQQRLALVGVAWVRQQRGDERSSRGRQRPPRRPDVQRGDVPRDARSSRAPSPATPA